MPQVKGGATLAAAGDTASIFAGSQYEVPNFNYQLKLAVLAAPGDAPTLNLTTGSDVLTLNAVIDEKATTLPITTEDFQFVDSGLAGEKIVGIITATAAGDVVRFLAVIRPI